MSSPLCYINSAVDAFHFGFAAVWDGWIRPNLTNPDSPQIPSNVPGSSPSNPYRIRVPRRTAKNWAKNKLDCGLLDNNPPNFPFNTPGGVPNITGGPCDGTPDLSWLVTVYNPSESSQIKYDPETKEIVITDVYNFIKSPNQTGAWSAIDNILRDAGLPDLADGFGVLADGAIFTGMTAALNRAGRRRKIAAGIPVNPGIDGISDLNGLKETYHEYRMHICSFKQANPDCYAAYVANGTFPNICCKDDDLDKNPCGGDPFENENPCE